MFSLLLQEFRFRRNVIIGWGLGVAMLPLMYIGIYPQFAEQMASFQELMDLAIYQAMGISMADYESYIASAVINIVPMITGIFAIINATGSLAGEEDEGRLELIVALPIPRWQIVATKALAINITLLLILTIAALVAAGMHSVISNQVETGVSAAALFLALLYAWPLVMATGMIALCLGAIAPSRRIAALLGVAIFLASYFGNNLSGLISSLDAIRPLFLHNYFDTSAEILRSGADAGDTLLLLAVALIAFLLTLFFFQRRDLTVGAWIWQRGGPG